MLGYRADFDFTNATGIQTEQKENSTELSGYIRYKIKTKKLILDPGIRIQIQFFGHFGQLGAKYLASDNLRFKLAVENTRRIYIPT